MAIDSIPETLITGPFVTPSSVANNVSSFTLTIVSSEWATVPGVVVAATVEKSTDNEQTWATVCGLTTVSGPLPPAPHDSMPGVGVPAPATRPKGNYRLRLIGTVSAPLRMGATIASS